MGFLGTKYIAVFYDNNGDFVGEKKFKSTDETITHGSGINERKFNVAVNECSFFDRFGWWRNKRYFFYNIDNPNPIRFDKKSEPIINSRLYNVYLETKVARDLNNLASGGLAQYLTFRNVVFGLIILGVIIYFASGGTLTGKPPATP